MTGEQEPVRCTYTTAAGTRCWLDSDHSGGHDPCGDDAVVDNLSYLYDHALMDYEEALGSRDPQRRTVAERQLEQATRALSAAQSRRVMARKWRQRASEGAPAPTWNALLNDPAQQLDGDGIVLSAILAKSKGGAR